MNDPSASPLVQLLPRWGLHVGTIVLLSVLLAVSAKIEVPFWPVPMTLETLAVLGLAGFFGARLIGLAILFWFAEGIAGLPVFAGPTAGPAYFLGPTGGYLAGFLLAALFVGWSADRGLRARPLDLFGAMIAGNALIYVTGVTWLAHLIGFSKAVRLGLVPFLPADLVKSMLATAIIAAASRLGSSHSTRGHGP
ncbi:MAG: biotin transporter BioY [Rhodospirillales bacterium]|nr:biotin transporter BioY [Rhodospirillales bacterium]